ncbi:hypothetical protein [Evansella clarkii]|uniref:hypothetical protein n=1 Tax=Evansella clarkii TaxID=79879 RepID=UPI001430C605|nr:hypothetical protein [Evansella clarkii]
MSEYTRLQIIKHALQYYIKRPEACEKDVEKEKKLLNKVTSEIEYLKEKYGI